MMIKAGEQIPDAVFTTMGPAGPEARSTADIFHGRAVALFAVAGAYTPTCHKQHLPGIIALSDEIKRMGIDTVACIAVNDIFVLDHWANEHGGTEKVLMLADGNAEFALKTGLLDRPHPVRPRRSLHALRDAVGEWRRETLERRGGANRSRQVERGDAVLAGR